jgi:hypothetical protein
MSLHLRLLALTVTGACLLVPRLEDLANLDDTTSVAAVDFQLSRDPVDREISSFTRDIRASLAARDYDALEAIAQNARETKARFGTGVWKLFRFYSAMPLSLNAADAAWNERIQVIRDWQAAKPNSPTASIALVEVYTGFARKMGIAASKALNPTNAKIFYRERLETALGVLENSRERCENDPHYWRAAHAIAAELKWPASRLDEIYNRVVAIEPEYWSNDFDRLGKFLARSQRETKSVEALVKADRCSAEIYARLAWEVNKVSGSFLEGMSFDWRRVQAGYRALTLRYPTSTGLLSQYCVMACRARDKDAARKCFVKLAGRADLSAFGSPREYERQLRWANWYPTNQDSEIKGQKSGDLGQAVAILQ